MTTAETLEDLTALVEELQDGADDAGEDDWDELMDRIEEAEEEIARLETRKGLRVTILNDVYTNRVPFDTLTLVGDGVPEVVAPNQKYPAVEVVPHRAGDQYPPVAVLLDGVESPAAFVAPGNSGEGWHMASGAWIYTSDSRFPYGHPVALHNRYEVKR